MSNHKRPAPDSSKRRSSNTATTQLASLIRGQSTVGTMCPDLLAAAPLASDKKSQLIGNVLREVLDGKINIDSATIQNNGANPGAKEIPVKEFLGQLTESDYKTFSTRELAKLGYIIGARPNPDVDAPHLLPSLSPALHRELAKRYEARPHFAALRDLDLLSFSTLLSRDFKTDSFITTLQTGKPASADRLHENSFTNQILFDHQFPIDPKAIGGERDHGYQKVMYAWARGRRELLPHQSDEVFNWGVAQVQHHFGMRGPGNFSHLDPNTSKLTFDQRHHYEQRIGVECAHMALGDIAEFEAFNRKDENGNKITGETIFTKAYPLSERTGEHDHDAGIYLLKHQAKKNHPGLAKLDDASLRELQNSFFAINWGQVMQRESPPAVLEKLKGTDPTGMSFRIASTLADFIGADFPNFSNSMIVRTKKLGFISDNYITLAAALGDACIKHGENWPAVAVDISKAFDRTGVKVNPVNEEAYYRIALPMFSNSSEGADVYRRAGEYLNDILENPPRGYEEDVAAIKDWTNTTGLWSRKAVTMEQLPKILDSKRKANPDGDLRQYVLDCVKFVGRAAADAERAIWEKFPEVARAPGIVVLSLTDVAKGIPVKEAIGVL